MLWPENHDEEAPSQPEQDADISCCSECSSPRVQMQDCERDEDSRYFHLLLICPDCGTRRQGRFTEQQTYLLADLAEEGFAELLHALRDFESTLESQLSSLLGDEA